MPKVSVLMPVYNTKEEYLREAIESILNQTFTDFEFVIINDGSTNENIEKVIKSYNDKRIRYFNQDNHGLIYTLNKGIELCKGEYIARMDSDDISLPKRLEKQVKYLDSNSSVGVIGSWINCFPQGKVVKLISQPKYFNLLQGNCFAHPSLMIRKSVLKQFNFRYGNYIHAEDYELWSRMIRYTEFCNIQEVLLNYRCHNEQISVEFSDIQAKTAKKIKQNMLDFLTDDKELQQKIMTLVCPHCENPKLKYTFWQKIFSIRNHNGCKHICILGITIKVKRKTKSYVIRLMGRLGNQMFQYAFGLALKAETGKQVLFDKSWFDEAKKAGKEFSNGVATREYNLDIFKQNISVATKKEVKSCRNKPEEENAFIFDGNLFKQPLASYYTGYFQNEKYFNKIQETIKEAFTFPEISEKDVFNQNWIKRINECENSVFIHLRRGDYLNLQGWALTNESYQKAIRYIRKRVSNPTFFVFGQDCEEYIKNELVVHSEAVSDAIKFEIIGEKNSKNKEDWKDIVLMMQCKHAIIANSTFSWWAAWLGKANEKGIVVAPTPFVNKQDEIICDNWVKIKRN